MSTRCNGACQKWVAREDNFEGGLMKRESKSVKKKQPEYYKYAGDGGDRGTSIYIKNKFLLQESSQV